MTELLQGSLNSILCWNMIQVEIESGAFYLCTNQSPLNMISTQEVQWKQDRKYKYTFEGKCFGKWIMFRFSWNCGSCTLWPVGLLVQSVPIRESVRKHYETACMSVSVSVLSTWMLGSITEIWLLQLVLNIPCFSWSLFTHTSVICLLSCLLTLFGAY